MHKSFKKIYSLAVAAKKQKKTTQITPVDPMSVF